MAEYNQLNEAQKRAVTDMAKKNLLPRGAAAYCELSLCCHVTFSVLTLCSFAVSLWWREN